MMTEEQKQALIKHNIAKINSITPQFMKEALPGVKRHLQCEIDSAKLALDSLGTALTQPASPALKFPETISVRTAITALDNASAVTTIAQSYKMAWNSCIAETKRLNAPHTAPIEPICATGGAEWVKPVPRELKQVLLELRTYNPKADEHGGKHIIPGWADRIEKALGIKPVAAEEE
jgi:hypothetical protein